MSRIESEFTISFSLLQASSRGSANVITVLSDS